MIGKFRLSQIQKVTGEAPEARSDKQKPIMLPKLYFRNKDF